MRRAIPILIVVAVSLPAVFWGSVDRAEAG